MVRFIFGEQTALMTCIIASITKENITVGGDSKGVHRMLNTQTQEVTETEYVTCKIGGEGLTYFAVSGNFGDEHYKIAKDCCMKGLVPKELFGLYIRTFATFLADKLEGIRKNVAPVSYDKRFQSDMPLSNILFFGYDGKELFLQHLILQNKYNSLRSPVIFPYTPESPEDIMAIGEVSEIEEQDLLKKKETWENGTVAGIKYLINFSKEHHPQTVGGPINIIEVTQKGATWIERKPPCA
jgi:hypothetical protein